MAKTQHQRPDFSTALAEWHKILTASGHSTECEWILDENLVFEKDDKRPSGVRLTFQTRFTNRPPNLAQVSYDFFTDYEARLVFYRVGTANGKSVCMLLCDPVFETRGEADGFVRRDDWLMSFHPGPAGSIEEITEEARWKNRLINGRPLNDVDFCLPLAVLRELDAHGRTLSPYERFGVRMLEAWQRWQRASE
jgi:hypothetical protein